MPEHKHESRRVIDEAPLAIAAMSDGELVDLVQVRPDALSELWQRHYRAAVRAAGYITNRFDPEDLASEAFARVLQAIRHGCGPTRDFRAYLYAALRAVSQSWHRDHDRLQVCRLPGDGFAGRSLDKPLLEEECADRILVRAAFRSLRPRWREVLWLTEVEGLPARAAAEIMGVTPPALSSLHVRARAALARVWDRLDQPASPMKNSA